MFLIISGPSYESTIHGYVTDERVAQDIVNDNNAKFTAYSEYWRKRNKLQHEYPQFIASEQTSVPKPVAPTCKCQSGCPAWERYRSDKANWTNANRLNNEKNSELHIAYLQRYNDMILRECGPVPDYIENLRYEEVKPYPAKGLNL